MSTKETEAPREESNGFMRLYTALAEHRSACRLCRPSRLCSTGRGISRDESAKRLKAAYEHIRSRHSGGQLFDIEVRLGNGWYIRAQVEADSQIGAQKIAQQYIAAFHPHWSGAGFVQARAAKIEGAQ